MPKDLNKPWEDPMAEPGERHIAQELRSLTNTGIQVFSPNIGEVTLEGPGLEERSIEGLKGRKKIKFIDQRTERESPNLQIEIRTIASYP